MNRKKKTFRRLNIVIIVYESMVIVINTVHFHFVFSLNHVNICLNIDLRERIFRKVPVSLSL